MQHQKSKKKKFKKRTKRHSASKKDPYGYQPDSPLTQHYLTTGAILPEKKKDQTGRLTNCIVLRFTRFFEISDNFTVGPCTISMSLEFNVTRVDRK